MAVLEIDSVDMSFGETQILSGIYLKAEKGKVTGILGSNGCGKTTLLRIIFGELKPKMKSLRIDGKTMTSPFLQSGDIKFLPQFHFLPKSMKVKTAFTHFNISFEEFIKDFPVLKVLENQKFKTLSGGEKRIIETYIILCSKSKFVLLDEPFSHIAPVHVEKIIELIHQEKQFKAIIVTDHMYKHIIDASDTLYLLKDTWMKKVENKNDLSFYNYTY